MKRNTVQYISLKNMKVTKSDVFEIIRFGIVGVIATALHYILYWLLRHWMNYNIAYTIGYALSFVCNFYLTSLFTFKTKATVTKGVGFTGAHLFNYLLQMCLLNCFVYYGVRQNIAPIFVYAIVIPIQFTVVRIVFKHTKTGKAN